jgi:hypothetical protein
VHTPNDSYDLVIVGGGQAAKALLMLLAERGMGHQALRPHMRVAIFERTQYIGPGIAWGPEQALAEHLSSQPGGASRPEYGREQLRLMPRLVELLRAVNVIVDLWPGIEIIDLRRAGQHWMVIGEQIRCRANAVVLATGHWRNTPEDLEDIPHHYPWPAKTLQETVLDRLSVGAQIAVLGSYHTAIDTALTIALATGRFERVGSELQYVSTRALKTTLLSRTGRLPLVWPPAMVCHEPTSRAASFEQPLRLEHLMTKICSELAGGRRHGPDARTALKLARMLGKLYLQDSLDTLDRSLQPEPWRPRNLQRIAAMATLLPQISEQFPLLDAESYLRFQREQRTSFFNVAMPMARATAERIRALLRVGALSIERIEGRRWQMANGKPTLVPARIANGVAIRSFDLLVNGLASCGPLIRHPGKLIRSLRMQQLIIPAYREFASEARQRAGETLPVDGVHVNPQTCEVVPARFIAQRESARYGLYAMGPNLGGSFLDAQSIGQLARDARRIVADLGVQERRIAS